MGPADSVFVLMWDDIAIIAAGVIGIIVAVIHGVIQRRSIIAPLRAILNESSALRGASRRLVVPLLHVSTLAWLVAGLLLVWGGFRGQSEARMVVSVACGALYLQAAVLNAIATRGRHPAWVLMGAAVLLIAAGLSVDAGGL